MAFVPAPGVARVELIYLQHGQRVENVFHFKVHATGPLTEAQIDSVQNMVNTWRVNNYRGTYSASTVLQQIEVRDMTVPDGIAKIYPCTANCAGVAVGVLSPGNVTAAIKWGTGYAGRSRRGRTFQVGLVANNISGNQLLPAFQTGLQAAAQQLITQSTAAGMPLVIYSRQTQGVSRDVALITTVLSATVEANLDSMRRRLTGPGRGD